MIALVIDALIPLACGTYVSLIGYGVVSPSRDRQKGEAWRKKWGGFARVAGPLIVLWGAYGLAAGFAPYLWQRISTDDGHASAEFPVATTKEAAVDTLGGFKVKRVTVRCNVPGKEINLRLSYSEIPAESPNLPVDQRIEAYKAYLRQQGMSVIACAPDPGRPFPSYRIVSEFHNGQYRTQSRVVIFPTAVYRVIATSSTSLASDPIIDRFLKSFAIR